MNAPFKGVSAALWSYSHRGKGQALPGEG